MRRGIQPHPIAGQREGFCDLVTDGALPVGAGDMDRRIGSMRMKKSFGKRAGQIFSALFTQGKEHFNDF